MDELKKLLKITNKQSIFTKSYKKPKYYDKVKDNIPLVADKNFMADYLFLPKTKQGYKYLLVVVDLATDLFDIEPMKDKKPESVINGILQMDKRPFIHFYEDEGQSIRTDAGNEFKGSFKDFCKKNSILLRPAIPNRHIQLPNVERLNGTLGTLLNGYMNGMELKNGKPYSEWINVIPTIRVHLNQIRKHKLPDNIMTHIYPNWDATVPLNTTSKKKKPMYKIIEPKYKIGDLVYVRLETPENALGEKQKGLFRNGDYKLSNIPKKIIKVLYYSGKPYYRYLVSGYDGVSYQEDELKPATNETDEKFEVKEILKRKKIKDKYEYLIWWRGEKKSEASWEPRDNLIKFVKKLIDNYDKAHS